MIRYSEGTVFNVDTQALVNTVNCVGVMGAGIALEFKLRYPEMFEDYATKCRDRQIVTGKVDYFKHEDGRIIVNFPTKAHFKYPSKLSWIEQGLEHFCKTYTSQGITSIAFPKLGTSHGGLAWNEVKQRMEHYLSGLDIDVYICLDTKENAEGVEKVMLDAFHATSTEQLSSLVRLNSRQKKALRENAPFDRFWKISQTESIGAKTYAALFHHFYQTAMGRTGGQQMSLFDS